MNLVLHTSAIVLQPRAHVSPRDYVICANDIVVVSGAFGVRDVTRHTTATHKGGNGTASALFGQQKKHELIVELGLNSQEMNELDAGRQQKVDQLCEAAKNGDADLVKKLLTRAHGNDWINFPNSKGKAQNTSHSHIPTRIHSPLLCVSKRLGCSG